MTDVESTNIASDASFLCSGCLFDLKESETIHGALIVGTRCLLGKVHIMIKEGGLSGSGGDDRDLKGQSAFS